MSKTVIPPASFEFLKKLSKNNNRDWFNAHKDAFLEAQESLVIFADALLAEMNKHDRLETESGKQSLLRIYRDVRFSKDKKPYQIRWGAFFKRATKLRRGNYYLHIEPGNSFVEGGFWGPEAHDLKRIRDEFAYDAQPMRKILKARSFVDTFGTLSGEQVKTAPKGFSADDPAIDLLRYKQFLLVKKFSDKEVLRPDFLKQANDAFKKMRPFLDYMTEVLTTDVNGISVIE